VAPLDLLGAYFAKYKHGILHTTYFGSSACISGIKIQSRALSTTIALPLSLIRNYDVVYFPMRTTVITGFVTNFASWWALSGRSLRNTCRNQRGCSKNTPGLTRQSIRISFVSSTQPRYFWTQSFIAFLENMSNITFNELPNKIS